MLKFRDAREPLIVDCHRRRRRRRRGSRRARQRRGKPAQAGSYLRAMLVGARHDARTGSRALRPEGKAMASALEQLAAAAALTNMRASERADARARATERAGRRPTCPTCLPTWPAGWPAATLEQQPRLLSSALAPAASRAGSSKAAESREPKRDTRSGFRATANLALAGEIFVRPAACSLARLSGGPRARPRHHRRRRRRRGCRAVANGDCERRRRLLAGRRHRLWPTASCFKRGRSVNY